MNRESKAKSALSTFMRTPKRVELLYTSQPEERKDENDIFNRRSLPFYPSLNRESYSQITLIGMVRFMNYFDLIVERYVKREHKRLLRCGCHNCTKESASLLQWHQSK